MKINKNQVGDGIFTSDNLVAGTNISMTQETETIVSGLDEYTQLYIPFNDSLSDMSSNNCTVTQTGTPYVTYTDGKFDKALSSITASSGYEPVKWTKSDSSKFSIADGFTFEYWQYVDTDVYGGGGPYQLWFGNDGGSIQFKAYFYVNFGDPVLSIKVGSPTSEVSGSTIAPYFNDKSWNHIAMTFSPSNYSRVFLNGHKVYEFTGSSWTSLSNLGSSYDGIQVNSDGSSFSEGRTGKYDELRLSNTIRYTDDFTPPTAPFGTITQRDVTKINNTQTIDALQNEATVDTSLNILGLTSNPNYLSRANVVVLGKDAYAQGTRETIIGYGAHSGYYTNNTGNVVIGYNARSTSTGDVVIGDTAKASSDSVSIGKSSEASSSSVAVGNSAISKADNAVCLGYNAHNDSSSGNSIAIGKGATVSSGFNGMAIGASSTASASGAIQIGAGTNSTSNSVQIDTYQVFDRSTGKIPAARMPITVADTSLSNLTAAGKDVGAELSFPVTNSYTDLVLGASGATYTATYNGYLVFAVSSTNANLAYVNVRQGDMFYQQVWFANGVSTLFPGGAIPITKGNFIISYGGIAGMTSLRLFYNQGNKPS